MERALAKTLPSRQFNKLDELDLRNLINPLLAEKWLVIGITLTIFIISIIYGMMKPPVYQSNVILEVQGNNDSLEHFGNNLLPLNTDETLAVNKQIALIKSRFILEPVINNLGLNVHVQPHYFPIIGEWYARHHAQSLQSPLLNLSSFAWGGEHLQIGSLNIQPDHKSSFTLVATGNDGYNLFNSKHHLILQGKVGAMENAFDQQQRISIQVNSLIANKGAKFSLKTVPTQALINQIDNNLAISDLADNSDDQQKTGVLQISLSDNNPQRAVNILSAIAAVAVQKDMDHKSLEAEKTLKFLNQQLPLIKTSLNAAEYKLNKYMAKRGSLDLPTETKLLLTQISTNEQQLDQLNVLKAEKLQQFTPQHPFIIQLNNQIMAVKQEIAQLKSRASKLPASDQIATNLSRDVQVKSQLYLLLLNKIQSLQVTKAGTVSDVRILSGAEYPDSPMPSIAPVIAACGLLIGFMLSCLYVYSRKLFKYQVDNPLWIEQRFGIPNIALIPYSPQQSENIKAFKSGNSKSLDLLAAKYPREISIEAIRSLRTSLHFSLQDAPNNLISVMGISTGVGKSFISSNIAHILADTGKRVLLIDCDMRRGGINKYFNCQNSPGLAEFLNNMATSEEIIRTTALATLDFLPTGKYPANPSELLLRPRFKELLDQASANYDFVIIDTVPVALVTDGLIIANFTGLNLLVLDSGAHSEQEIELAISRLSNTGIKIAGTIFNHTSVKSAHYGYGYSYNYNYS